MSLSVTGYAQMSRELVAMAEEFCAGRILFTLEGGYNLDALAYGVLNAFHALTGDDTIVDPIGPAPQRERPIDTLLENLRSMHDID